ncbi:MAG: hypothetical protein ABH851_00750 [Methanobacteriota archaeon]
MSRVKESGVDYQDAVMREEFTEKYGGFTYWDLDSIQAPSPYEALRFATAVTLFDSEQVTKSLCPTLMSVGDLNNGLERLMCTWGEGPAETYARPYEMANPEKRTAMQQTVVRRNQPLFRDLAKDDRLPQTVRGKIAETLQQMGLE